MNHPIALVLVARIQIIVAHVEELLDVLGKLVEKGISMPDFVENDQRKFVGA